MKLACDVMLGKLAKYLRALGFDTAYLRSPAAIDTLAGEDPQRILLTRRHGCTGYPHSVIVHSEDVRQQLQELKGLIGPHIDTGQMLTRCLECNSQLMDAERKDIEHLVPEFVYHQYARFKRCPSCGKVYWAGSHTEHMAQVLKEVLG
jgi:uncharacterized protein